ncbi:MAG: hypothetical protein N2554_11550 [Fimbriimonadales bacterium]|nr:hypothetical protein [Fimbriimonadales bacterium]
MKVGIIDIGSNSVLLLVGEHTETGWRTLLDTARITRLGEGFSKEQTLQPHAIERTLLAIDEYLETCRAMGVERVIAVATGVVRTARNQEAFAEQVRQRLRPGSTEGRTGERGNALHGILFPKGDETDA